MLTTLVIHDHTIFPQTPSHSLSIHTTFHSLSSITSNTNLISKSYSATHPLPKTLNFNPTKSYITLRIKYGITYLFICKIKSLILQRRMKIKMKNRQMESQYYQSRDEVFFLYNKVRQYNLKTIS